MSTPPANTLPVIDVLMRVVAETIVFAAKAQSYHWNVRGPNFVSLHALFEEQYRESAEAGDGLAERLRALQAPAPAGLQAMLALSRLNEPIADGPADAMIADLLESQDMVRAVLAEGLAVAEKAGDAVTADMLTNRLEAHEKQAWMLRSHLE